MAFNIEMTDTFGGEANYCWVKRAHIAAENLTDRQIVRRAKAWAGLTGARCRVDIYGDSIAIYPRGACIVVFVNHCASEHAAGEAI